MCRLVRSCTRNTLVHASCQTRLSHLHTSRRLFPSSRPLYHSLQFSRNAMKAFPQLLGPIHRIERVGVWQERVLMVDQGCGVVGRQFHHHSGILVHLGRPRLKQDRLLIAAGKPIGDKLNVEILVVQFRFRFVIVFVLVFVSVFTVTRQFLEHLSHTSLLRKCFQKPSRLKGVRKTIIVKTGVMSPMVREVQHGRGDVDANPKTAGPHVKSFDPKFKPILRDQSERNGVQDQLATP